jgi:transaldolase
MKFFVDTADTAEIKSPAVSGLPGGVTADPSLVTKTGKKFTDIIHEIRVLVFGARGSGTDVPGRASVGIAAGRSKTTQTIAC